MSEVQLLNKVNHPDQSKAIQALDTVLFCAREGLGYEEITFKVKENPKPGEPAYHQEQAKKVNNVFVRVLCVIAAFTVLLVPTLIALAVKCCLKSSQDKDIQKMNKLVEKHATSTNAGTSSTASKTASVTLPNEEKKTQTQTRSTPQKPKVKDKQDKKSSESVQGSNEEKKTQAQSKSTLQKPVVKDKEDKKSSETIQGSQKHPTPQDLKIASADGDKKGSAPSEKQKDQGPLVIKLDELISCWKQLANAKGRTAINEGLQRIKQVDPQGSSIENNPDEQIISAAEQSVEAFEALADLADKALAGKSIVTIIKNDKTGFLLRYLASRAIALQGKSRDDFDTVYDNLEANPDQPIVKKIAEELKQKGFVSDYYGEKPKTFEVDRSLAPAPSEKKDQTPKAINLNELLSSWKQAAAAVGSQQFKEALQRLIKVDPNMSFLEGSSDEEITHIAKESVKEFQALADFAELAVNGKPYEKFFKNYEDDKYHLGYPLRYVTGRILSLKGYKGDERMDKMFDVEESLLKDPRQPIVLQIAKELREQGWIRELVETETSEVDASKATSKAQKFIKLDLILSGEKQLAEAKTKEQIAAAVQRMKTIDPKFSALDDVNVNIKISREHNVPYFQAITDFAEKARKMESFDDLIKNNRDVRGYIANRIWERQPGPKTENRWMDEIDTIDQGLIANPRQPIVYTIAQELREQGWTRGIQYDESGDSDEEEQAQLERLMGV